MLQENLWSAFWQQEIFSEELPRPIKQRRDELRKKNFFVSLHLQYGLLILVDSYAEGGGVASYSQKYSGCHAVLGHLFGSI